MYKLPPVRPLSLPPSELGSQLAFHLPRHDSNLLQGLALLDGVTVAAEIRGAVDRAFSVWTSDGHVAYEGIRSRYEPIILKRRAAPSHLLFRMALIHESKMDDLLSRPGFRDRDSLLVGAVHGYIGERTDEADFPDTVRAAIDNLRRHEKR